LPYASATRCWSLSTKNDYDIIFSDIIDSIQKIRFFFASKLKVRIKNCPDDDIVVSKEKSGQLKQWLDR